MKSPKNKKISKIIIQNRWFINLKIKWHSIYENFYKIYEEYILYYASLVINKNLIWPKRASISFLEVFRFKESEQQRAEFYEKKALFGQNDYWLSTTFAINYAVKKSFINYFYISTYFCIYLHSSSFSKNIQVLFYSSNIMKYTIYSLS